MFCKCRPTLLLCGLSYTAIILGVTGACSPEHYKAQADKDVYQILDKKWQPKFGPKANYKISDVTPSPNDINIPSTVPSESILSLAEAVTLATAYNRDYQTQKENLYLSALDLTSVRHQFTRNWFATIDSTYDSVAGDQSINTTGAIGFNQILATGAQISTNIALDWSQFITGNPQTTLRSVLSATVTQPLLAGSGQAVVQEGLTQAERNVLYQLRAFNFFRQTFVVSIVNDYYRVLQQRDVVTNQENNYKRRLESQERLEMEAQAGRRPPIEVDQAMQDVLSAKDTYVQAQQNYKQALDSFKIRLALPTDANIVLDQNELKGLAQLPITDPDYTLDMAVETGLIRRLDLATTADRIDDAVRKIVVAESFLGAVLDLVASANVGSRPINDFPNLQFEEGRYQAGIHAELPLDRLIQRNAYREALIVLEQQRREYENSVDVVKLEVRDDYRSLIETAERYNIQKNSLALAEKRVESTSMLIQAGQLTARDLLEAQDDLVDAQNNLTAVLVDHTIAKLRFFQDIGVLQVKPDGMWQLDNTQGT